MAKKKRKTIPKEYDTYEIMKSGDVEKLEELYDRCEYAALESMLYSPHVNEKALEWFLEKGTDLNQPIGGSYVLVRHAMWDGDLKLFVEHGADVHIDNDSLLRTAVHYAKPETVKTVLDFGLDVKKREDLLLLAVHCSPLGFPDCEKIVRLLLEKGCPVSKKTKKELRRVAEEYEDRRDYYAAPRDPEIKEKYDFPDVEEIDAALDSMYKLLNVEPVPKVNRHDGISPISVPKGSTEEQFEILYDFLVPSLGKAKSMQGEAIRIIGRVNYGLSKGRENLNSEEHKMMKWFVEFLKQGNSLSLEEIKQADALRISRLNGEKIMTLAGLAIKWIEMNPNPFPLHKD